MRKLKDEMGQVLIVTALSMTVLLGFTALATDVGMLLRQRRMAQSAADAAALGAVMESLNENTPSSVSAGMWTAASHDAIMNGFTPGASNGVTNSSSGVTLTLNVNPGIGISGFNSAGYLQSIVALNTHTVFMNLFGVHSMNVSATAIASDDIQSGGCIYVQNGGNHADPAVDMGGNSLIAASNCGMTVNGNLTLGGNGTIQAKFVAVSGTFSGKNAGNWSEGVAPQNDPLSKLQDTANQPTVPSGTKAGGACTAPAGSGMSCIYDYNDGNLSGTLQSNTIYYFDSLVNKGGGPSISGAASGSHITIYLAGNIPFDFDNNGSGTFTAPGFGGDCIGSANPLCGVLIAAPTDGSSGGTYTCSHGKGNNAGNPGELYFDFGSSTTDLEGIVYAPYMQVFGQDKGASTTFNTNLIIGNICMQSATFDMNGFSGPQSPLTRVGLVY